MGKTRQVKNLLIPFFCNKTLQVMKPVGTGKKCLMLTKWFIQIRGQKQRFRRILKLADQTEKAPEVLEPWTGISDGTSPSSHPMLSKSMSQGNIAFKWIPLIYVLLQNWTLSLLSQIPKKVVNFSIKGKGLLCLQLCLCKSHILHRYQWSCMAMHWRKNNPL